MRTWNGTRIFALALALLLCLSLLPTTAFAGELDVQSILDAYASGDQDALMSLLGAPGSNSEQADSQEPAPQEGETDGQLQQPAAGDHTHVFVTYEPVKAPTCTEPGLEEAVCLVEGCGATDQHEIPALGHKFTERIPEEAYLKSDTPEDCVHPGVYFLACAVCGASAEETYTAAVEQAKTDVYALYQAASKEEQNNMAYWEAEVNARIAVLDAQYSFSVPATGVHNMQYVDGQPATCTEDGFTAYQQCAGCGHTEGYEVIPATGHTLEPVEGKPATCTEDGFTAYQKCANCDYTEGYEVIPAAGHSFEAGVCTVCGAEDPDYVAPVAEVTTIDQPAAEEPEVEEPKAEEPEVEEPKAEEPEVEEPKAEEPEVEEPKAEEPEVEEPKAEEPEVEEPKAEEPEAEEPKAEEPKAEEPKAEEPKAEEPKAEPLDTIIPEKDAEGRQSFINYMTYGPLSSMPFDTFEVYDVTPVKANGEALTPNEAAARDDIVFTLPFPDGTDDSTNTFLVFHGGESGWEQIPASYLTIGENGIIVTGWKSFSPFAVLAMNKVTGPVTKVTIKVKDPEVGQPDDVVFVGQTLYVASVEPAGLEAEYVWCRGTKEDYVTIKDSTGREITAQEYTLTAADCGKGIFCSACEVGNPGQAKPSNGVHVRDKVGFDIIVIGEGTYTITEKEGFLLSTPDKPYNSPDATTIHTYTENKLAFKVTPQKGSGDNNMEDYVLRWITVDGTPIQGATRDTTDEEEAVYDIPVNVVGDGHKIRIYFEIPTCKAEEKPTQDADSRYSHNPKVENTFKERVNDVKEERGANEVKTAYYYVTPHWIAQPPMPLTATEISALNGLTFTMKYPEGVNKVDYSIEVYHFNDADGEVTKDDWTQVTEGVVLGDSEVMIENYKSFSPFGIVALKSDVLTFDDDGATGGSTPDPMSVVKGKDITIPDDTPEKEGAAFVGWKDSDGNIYHEGDSFTPNGSSTLTAVWTDKTVTVTYTANGGSGADYTQLLPKGKQGKLKAMNNQFSAPASSGFAGWNTAADGKGTGYADHATVTLNDDTTLYAQWAKAIPVTINKNDGSAETWTDSATVGTDYVLPDNPFTVPDGKTFAGYSASTDGSVGFYKAGEKMPVDESATEVVLYAIWGDNTALAATVSLSGEYVETVATTSGQARLTVIGDTLYASVSDLNAPMGTLMYQWIRTDGTSQTRLTEQTIGGNTYTPTAADFGYRIFCVVTSTVRSGYRASSGIEIAVEYGAHDRILNDGNPNQNGYPGDLIGAVTGMSYSIDGGVWTEVPAGTVMNDGSASSIVTRTVTKPGVYRFRGPAPTYKESSYTLTFKPWYSVAVNVTNPGYGTVRFNPDSAIGTHERITGYENVRLVLKGQGEVITLTPSSGYYAYYRVDGGTWISGVTRTTTGTGATATTSTTSVPVTITLSAIDRPHVIDVQFLAVGTSPRTGDTSNIGLWAALGFASFAGLVTLAGTERKRRKNRA